MRDTERMPRHAVLAAAAPFGFAGGTRLALHDRSAGRHDRPGHRPLPRLGDDRANPLEGRRPGAAAAAMLDLPASQRSAAQAEELAAAFRATQPAAEADARRARCRAEGARRTRDSVDARHGRTARASSGRRSSCACAAASPRRASASTPARRAALHPMRDDQPVNRLGLARWLVDRGQPAGRARRGQPAVGADLRPRPGRDQRGLRLAGQRRRRIPSCSTGWRPSSSRRAGARRRCIRVIVTVGDLPAVVGGHAAARGARSRTTACSRAARGSGWRPR